MLKSLFSLICMNEKDYILGMPKLTDLEKNAQCNTHCTLHTENNRVTWKVTDINDSNRNFEHYLNEAEKNEHFDVTKYEDGKLKDIDMYKNKHFLFKNNSRNIESVIHFELTDFYNKDRRIFDLFSISGKSCKKYREVINVEIPKKVNDIAFDFYVCKNLENDYILKKRRKKESTYEKIFIIEDKLNNDIYQFILAVNNGNIFLNKNKEEELT